MTKFGPSGACEEFVSQNFKRTCDGAKWLKEKGADLFEYSFGRGVNISLDTAKAYGKVFQSEGVEMSVHAPYFINLATQEDIKKENNLRYIFDSLKACSAFLGERVVFHPGSPLKLERKEAMKILLNSFENLMILKQDSEYKDMYLCPETMGKENQLGDLKEIIDICNLGDHTIIPCIDFGHLNSRYQGSIKTKDDYKKIIDTLIDGIGEEKTRKMHVHFSKIQYGAKGEIKHLTFEDDVFGPQFEPLLEVFNDYKIDAHVLCESAGTQTRDAMAMKNYYLSILKD